MRQKLLHILLPALTGALVIGLWYAIHFALSDERRFILPTPDAVLSALVDNRDALWRATVNTSEGALLGFAAAIVISSVLALVLSSTALVRASLYPYLMILQMTPIIVIGPILVLWVGPGLKSVTV